MTAYIVREGARKKREILEKREAELVHQLNQRAPDGKLAKAAEKVRIAQQAVIKCMLHESEAVRPEDEVVFAKRWQELERDRSYWEFVPAMEIISHYRALKREPEGGSA
jgi:hypothetical protein